MACQILGDSFHGSYLHAHVGQGENGIGLILIRKSCSQRHVGVRVRMARHLFLTH